VRRLERGELAQEPVVLRIGEDRLVEDVVGVVGRADLLAQLARPCREFSGHARRLRRDRRRRNRAFR